MDVSSKDLAKKSKLRYQQNMHDLISDLAPCHGHIRQSLFCGLSIIVREQKNKCLHTYVVCMCSIHQFLDNVQWLSTNLPNTLDWQEKILLALEKKTPFAFPFVLGFI